MQATQSAEPAYALAVRMPRVQHAERLLFLMAGLALLDGVYLGELASGKLLDPLDGIGFGCSVFSGAGCWGAVAMLDGSFRQRLAVWARVYATVALGAALIVACLPALSTWLIADFRFFSALILLTLATSLLGLRLPRGTHLSRANRVRIARATRPLRLAARPGVVPVVVLQASLLRVITGPSLNVEQVVTPPALALIPVLAGAGLTLGAVVLLSQFRSRLNPVWVRRGSGLALLLIGLSILQAPVPTGAPLAAWLAALIVGAFREPKSLSLEMRHETN